MFLGAAALSLDVKGRLAIPARHRKALSAEKDGSPAENEGSFAGSFVLTAHPHHCLLLYPLAAWEPMLEGLLAVSSLDEQAASYRRLLMGYARPENLDAAGRVLIAPELRKWAELDKQVWLVGQGRHLELWSEPGWQREQEKMAALSGKPAPASLQNLVL